MLKIQNVRRRVTAVTTTATRGRHFLCKRHQKLVDLQLEYLHVVLIFPTLVKKNNNSKWLEGR